MKDPYQRHAIEAAIIRNVFGTFKHLYVYIYVTQAACVTLCILVYTQKTHKAKIWQQ